VHRRIHLHYLIAAVLLAAAALSFATAVWGNYRLPSPDAMAYADTARHIVRGHGAMSGRLAPVHLHWLTFRPRLPASAVRIPSFANYTWPVALAPWFAVFGAGDRIAMIAALLWWLAAGLLTFAAARRLGGTAAGYVALAIFALHSRSAGYALHGLSEPLSQAFFLAGLFLLLPRKRGSLPLAAAAGIAVGLAFGVRQSAPFLGMALLVAGSLAQANHRWRTMVTALAAFTVTAALIGLVKPALYPQPDLTGHAPDAALLTAPTEIPPTYPGWFDFANRLTNGGLLAFTDLYPNHRDSTMLTAVAPPADQAVAAFWRKIRTNVAINARLTALGIGGAGLTLLFWLSFFARPRAPGVWAWYAATVAMLLTTIALSTPLFVMERYFDFLLPFAVVPIGVAAATLADKVKASRGGVSAVATLVLVAAAATLPTIYLPLSGAPAGDAFVREATADRDQAYRTLAGLLRKTGADDVIATDVPWACAWLAERVCVMTPADEAALDDLRRRVRVRWLALTFSNPAALPYWRDWAAEQEQTESDAWVFARGASTGGAPLLLFTEKKPPA
jgi:hypothetical protein